MDAAKGQAYFAARIRNLFELCEKLHCPRFSDFLNEEEAAAAASIAERARMPFLFWGGFFRCRTCCFGSFSRVDGAGSETLSH